MKLVFHGSKALIFPKNNSCKLHFLLYQRGLIELVRHCKRKSNKCHQATLPTLPPSNQKCPTLTTSRPLILNKITLSMVDLSCHSLLGVRI